MATCKFFYTGSVEGLILDCYRLAKHYSRDPDEFLNKPISSIQRHMEWTAKLIELQRQQEDDE